MASLGRVEFSTSEVIAHMPRCRGCKWWTRQDDTPVESGLCGLADKDSNGPVHSGAMFLIPEGTLFTHPDFGCVQFEAKS
jgi:hypothetical protein